MRQVVIQKKYLLFLPILTESGEILWRIFLIIVNYIFHLSKKVKKVFEEGISFSSLLENIFQKFLILNKLRLKKVYAESSYLFKAKDDFEIYRNLVAPPNSRWFNLKFMKTRLKNFYRNYY